MKSVPDKVSDIDWTATEGELNGQGWSVVPRLLAPAECAAIAKMYGVPFEGRNKRQTIVVGRDGRVEHVYRTVDVTVHAKEILADLDHLPAGT